MKVTNDEQANVLCASAVPRWMVPCNQRISRLRSKGAKLMEKHLHVVQFIRGVAAAGAASVAFPNVIRPRATRVSSRSDSSRSAAARFSHEASHRAVLQCRRVRLRWTRTAGTAFWAKRAGSRPKATPTAEACSRTIAKGTRRGLRDPRPDHSHFAPSMTAVSMGIQCYIRKPLSLVGPRGCSC